jgi:hypothetical protein
MFGGNHYHRNGRLTVLVSDPNGHWLIASAGSSERRLLFSKGLGIELILAAGHFVIRSVAISSNRLALKVLKS